MTEKTKVTLYTDGACSGNPGAGGYGAILVHVDSNGIKHEKEFSAGYEHTTNNQMELLAVIIGLEALKKPCNVTVYSDSKYVVDAFNNKWIEGWIAKGWRTANKAPVKNVELWKRLLKAKDNHDVEFIWVKGHASNEYNNLCDKLAVEARSKENLEIDSNYLN
jgi:ribonuclease HI